MVQVDDWISTKDKLPEGWVEVLFYDKGLDEVRKGCFDGDDRWLSEKKFVAYHNVTHWQLLPNKPKGQ